MGDKAGKGSTSTRRRPSGRQRLGLVVFGAAFVLLFVGFAIAQGIGAPDVPSGYVAIVQGAPGDIGKISEEDFDHALEQQAAQAKLPSPPKPGSDKYEEMKKAALGELLDRVWIQGQGEEMGISATDKQLEDELARVKEQSFSAPGSYQEFLKESHFTQEDVNDRLTVQVLSNEIQTAVNEEQPEPSESEVESYYEEEKATQFTTKESRDVRIILNEDKGEVEAAKQALEGDSSPESWAKAAKKFSSDPTSSSRGGLQEGITEEFLQGAVKTAIFGSEKGELVGPVKFQTNWLLVEVVKENPEEVKPLSEVKAQIEETLKNEKQQEFFASFVSSYQSRWTSRTYCASGFVIERCANYAGAGHPANAASSCYEADPKTPPTECPAPVTQAQPAAPGSVTTLEPKGKQFPQRPRPSAAAPSGEAVEPGA